MTDKLSQTVPTEYDLTISIVFSGNTQMMRDCLDSIKESTHSVKYQVWIIDNATDGTGRKALQTDYPELVWIVNQAKEGFSTNHNKMLEAVESPYACILNDDTIIHDGAFDTLVDYLADHSDVGAIGAKLLNPDGSVQNCVFHPRSLKGELVGICFLPKSLCGLKTIGLDQRQFGKETVEVSWVLGACIVVRTEALKQVGLLDSVLSPVVNSEEEDWCYRFKDAGWKVVYCPDAVITHIGGQSINSDSSGPSRVRIEMHRTRINIMRKHHGWLSATMLRAIYVLTLPWNTMMLMQSLLRKTISKSRYSQDMNTLLGISYMSLFAPNRCWMRTQPRQSK